MTANKALQSQDIQYYGEHGNLSVAIANFTLAAAVTGDTVDFLWLGAGFDIMDAHIISANLGSGTIFNLGHRHVDGSTSSIATPDSIISSGVTNAAVRIDMGKAPVTEVIKDSIIYGTVSTSGAAPTGRVDVVIEYRVKGTQ